MAELNHFFSAPNLDEEESAIIPTAKEEKKTGIETNPEQIKAGQAIFASSDLDGSPLNVGPHKNRYAAVQTSDSPAVLEEEQKKKLSELLSRNTPNPSIKRVPTESPKERVIIRFVAAEKRIARDIDVPLSITANDLIVGLNEAYHLGMDISDARQCYLSCENPIVLLRGNQTLGEFGIRDGSLIACYR